MGAGKGQTKRIKTVSNKQRARVMADHQELWPWLKENGLNSILLSEYYLSGVDAKGMDYLSPAQVGYIFTEYFRDLILEAKCLKITLDNKDIDPYEYKFEYKDGLVFLINVKTNKVLGEWSNEYLRGEPLLENVTFKASSKNIPGSTGTNHLSIISKLFKTSSF